MVIEHHGPRLEPETVRSEGCVGTNANRKPAQSAIKGRFREELQLFVARTLVCSGRSASCRELCACFVDPKSVLVSEVASTRSKPNCPLQRRPDRFGIMLNERCARARRIGAHSRYRRQAVELGESGMCCRCYPLNVADETERRLRALRDVAALRLGDRRGASGMRGLPRLTRDLWRCLADTRGSEQARWPLARRLAEGWRRRRCVAAP